MSEASEAAPIKVGFFMDYLSGAAEDWTPFSEPMDLVFRDGHAAGLIDRPVEIVYRGAQGLPKGSVKDAIAGFGELVDEGCVAIVGPHISENAVAMRAEVERRFQLPAISVCGSEDWLGEW